jgi:hypothetical protein
MQNRYYFTEDGSYGIVDSGFTILNVDGFTDAMFDDIDEASDFSKIEYAIAYRDLLDVNAGFDDKTTWSEVPDLVERVTFVLETMYADEDVNHLRILIQRISDGLGL